MCKFVHECKVDFLRKNISNTTKPLFLKKIKNKKNKKRFVFKKLVFLQLEISNAGVAKLADASDLGSDAERRGGSSPFIRTK